MKIYIEVSVLLLATYITGIQRVTREIATRLVKDSAFEIKLLYYNNKESCFYKIDQKKFLDYYISHNGKKEKMITQNKIMIDEIEENSIFFDIDASWMGKLKRSFLLPKLKSNGVKVVAHIYDIISITHPQFCLERGVFNFMDFFGAHLQYADYIIVNASATISEIDKVCSKLNFEKPICEVVKLGADFKELCDDDIVLEEKFPSDIQSRPYLLMVGTIEPRKNHKLLLEAYEKGLKEMGYNIIFAGSIGWKMEEFYEKLKKHQDYQKRIFHFERLNDAEISYLYKNARFLIFASYIEGFGLPIIEGLQRGTPVISVDLPYAREVGNNYCYYFKQDDAMDLIQRVKLFQDKPEKYSEWKEHIKQSKFDNWDISYKSYVECLQKTRIE